MMIMHAPPSLDFLHDQVHEFIHTNVTSALAWQDFERVIEYWANNRDPYTDILPTLACIAAGGDVEKSIPLSSFWLLYILAARIFDDIQDDEGNHHLWNERGLEQALPTGLVCLSTANACLSRLDTDTNTLRQILNTFNSAWAFAAKSQTYPPKDDLSLEQYLENIIASSGNVFSAAVWAGARLATTDENTLEQFKQYGLNTGIVGAIIKDCLDMSPGGNNKQSDLVLKNYKLPVIGAVTLKEHPLHSRLMMLLDGPLTSVQVEDVLHILDAMGTIEWSMSVATIFQQKAIAALEPFANAKKEHLVNYVTTR